MVAGKYRAAVAQARAEGLSTKPRVESRLQSSSVLRKAVMDYLRLGTTGLTAYTVSWR